MAETKGDPSDPLLKWREDKTRGERELCLVTGCCHSQRPGLGQRGDSSVPLLEQREHQSPAGQCQSRAKEWRNALCGRQML